MDTSNTERLEVTNSDNSFRRLSYRVLLPLKNLRTLTLSRCKNPYGFLVILYPNAGAMACLELEEIVLLPLTVTEVINVDLVAKIAATRASRGAKLRTVRIVGGQDRVNPGDVLELKKYVSHVEYDPEVSVASDESDDNCEEFW